MFLKGMSQMKIAAHFGVHRHTIGTDIDTIFKEWRASAVRDFEQHRMEMLEKLNLVESEAWGQWEQSKQDVVTTELAGDAEGAIELGAVIETTPVAAPAKIKHTRKGQCANASYMSIVLDCIEKRCNLLALYPPKNIKITDPRRQLAEFLGVKEEDIPDERLIH